MNVDQEKIAAPILVDKGTRYNEIKQSTLRWFRDAISIEAQERVIVMVHRPSWRLLIVTRVIAACITIELGACASIKPADNALVGQTETEVCAIYGHPKREFAGHYGLPPLAWTRQFKGEVKTDVFRRLDGEIYVTYEKRSGQWVVISNSYLPHGGAF
jgi:hypothetical protein